MSSLAAYRSVISRKMRKIEMRMWSKLGVWPVSPLKDCDLKHIPVYCISLASATGRRVLMSRQAAAMGFSNFTFFDAVEASSLDRAALITSGLYDEAAAIRYHGRPLTLGEIACSLSHAEVYDGICADGHAYALVIEDDALFIPRRLAQLRLVDFPSGFDIAFLNYFRSVEPPFGHLTGNIYQDTSYEGSSAAYIVSRSGGEKLKSASRPVVHAADGLLGRSLRRSASAPSSFRQQGARTQITGYLIFPECVLNGSDLRFTATTLASNSPK